jgi:hypothetical protein
MNECADPQQWDGNVEKIVDGFSVGGGMRGSVEAWADRQSGWCLANRDLGGRLLWL